MIPPFAERAKRIADLRRQTAERFPGAVATSDDEDRDALAWALDMEASGQIDTGEPEPRRNGQHEHRQRSHDEPEYEPEPFPPILSIHELRRQHPKLRQPIIDGLLRRGEVANIIARSKAGKSWLTYGLALSVATGQDWLGQFACTPGRVLLVDNELHRETIAYRIPAVADAMSISAADYDIDVLSLRGQLRNIYELAVLVDDIEPDKYRLVLIDAFYRMLPNGISENSNADIAQIYNTIDRYGAKTGAAFGLIHHTTKGSQTDKATTDVGSGAGSQSRAVDAHIVFREHENQDCTVLDVALRSFAPVEPFGVRWTFPVWTPDESIDPAALKGRKTRGEERQQEQDDEADGKLYDLLTSWRSARELRNETGFSDGRINRALARFRDAGALDQTSENRRGNECKLYRLK